MLSLVRSLNKVSKNYSVFISHRWDYGNQLISLKNLLNKEEGLIASYEEVTVEQPINSENSSYIKGVLKGKILNSDVFIVVAGMYTAYSDWMEWEINTAVKNNIPVLGIKPRSAKRIPSLVSNNATEIVGWYTPSIVFAIRKLAK
ncbi:TIR domain-containing protein [Pseudomonas sp. CCI3.2]|uniref:TIR domain-containing protein n=1 Tax=unclassified Pseudomonas TaxID=196821 RepID=UPI002AC98403|nr:MULTISPECIES: TIR domain-containing protein [unclassified Pseudomonas]MEB0077974.1 TIR domain-containing protein [Pseudomonas sp. MH10out]MEB0093468.1 TIR domain-containing protein [Pseudomonas sp. CCI4.2]MEB0101688.1 TIR domain-containing protein [Pseudomonas sp. CCI3.2]MEB0129438.1 TIR domain-containing protein [Pseudomonas sp. CCI2.4]MEB0159193.1 TIR domain-containing protein [Pseudomonas sp. AH2 (2023)]